jgi:hypothetical protein
MILATPTENDLKTAPDDSVKAGQLALANPPVMRPRKPGRGG